MVGYHRKKRQRFNAVRLRIVSIGIYSFIAVIIVRLFLIQVIAHDEYQAKADKQHLLNTNQLAVRGQIYARDRTNEDSDILYPLAANRIVYRVYINPEEITRPINTAESLAEILGVEYELVLERAKKEGDIYEPITNRAIEEQIEALKATDLPGIHWVPESWRFYPDNKLGSHILGFYGLDNTVYKGKYGLEGYWDTELAGTNVTKTVITDSKGGVIPDEGSITDSSVDGVDLVLTIDRTIQYEVCTALERTIEQFAADTGTVIVMEPSTGKLLAMCNYPAFDPNNYNRVEDISIFNNSAVFEAYEPGSVFKPLAMAIAIDTEKVTPATTYEDTGLVTIAEYPIRNFDEKAHGMKTMVEVLQESLNLGMIFATHKVDNKVFYDYITKFGFGEKTGLQISQESAGSLGSLATFEDIYKATVSFGQGLTVTPLQMITAVNALANGGLLLKPIIVNELQTATGEVITNQVTPVRQVVSAEAAQTVAAMMVNVLDNGNTKRAAVEGYYLAGKTGTAQIAEKGRYGSKTNHTFVGFGPIDNPQFTILIKMHNVKNVRYAADSTAQLYHDISQFLLHYYKIPPKR